MIVDLIQFWVPIFGLIYLFFGLIILRHHEKKWLISSRFLGLSHALIILYHCIPYIIELYPNYNYMQKNTDQDIIINTISLSYFIVDTIHFFFFEINDFLMLLHHCVCFGYIGTGLYSGYGCFSFVVGLLFES